MPAKIIPQPKVYCSHCGKELAGTKSQRDHARAGERVYCPQPAECRRLGRPKVAKQPLEERFLRYTKSLTNGCIEWTSTVIWNGYGQINIDRRNRYAHHFAWFRHYGYWPPKGMELDHICHDPETCKLGRLCHHRRCVNWGHLRLVKKHTENNSHKRSNAGWHTTVKAAAQTSCIHNHKYTEENTYYTPDGKRQCIKCRKIREEKRRERKSNGREQ